MLETNRRSAINDLDGTPWASYFWKNSNESERREFNANLEDIVAWCETKFDEFDEIDAALREKQILDSRNR